MYIDIKRIEFVITNSCSGNCKHCSVSDHASSSGSINPDAGAFVIKQLSERFAIESVMTFGGEPLLYADAVNTIHRAARTCGIPRRQIITNGFFSRDKYVIEKVAKALCAAGINDILLSVDAFHQEYIPLEPVMQFADELVKNGAPSLRIQPAWLVNEAHDNPYNAKTKFLLKLFSEKEFKIHSGNIIFPAGNALKYLSEWFPPPEQLDLTVPCGSMPYTSQLDNLDSISISPNGDVITCSAVIGNIYNQDILEIIDTYDPFKIPHVKTLLEGGVPELLQYAETLGLSIDISNCCSACGVCQKVKASIEDIL